MFSSTLNLPISHTQFSPYVHHIEIGPKVSGYLENAGSCGKTNAEKYHVKVCVGCGYLTTQIWACKSELCPECAKTLLDERVGRAFRILEPYLKVMKCWSHQVFTIPAELRDEVKGCWEELSKLTKAAISISLSLVGKGGFATAHPFSSQHESEHHPHVHVITYARRYVDWDDLRAAWEEFLFEEYGYQGPSNVYEERFLKGGEKPATRKRKLRHKLKYCLRLPTPERKNYHHFEVLLGHQKYRYFGTVLSRDPVHNLRSRREPNRRDKCPDCETKLRILAGVDGNYRDDSWVRWGYVDIIEAEFPEKIPQLATLLYPVTFSMGGRVL